MLAAWDLTERVENANLFAGIVPVVVSTEAVHFIILAGKALPLVVSTLQHTESCKGPKHCAGGCEHCNKQAV
eukprot:scaffold119363_cov16-Tisochrysis_lutea.AAC.1